MSFVSRFQMRLFFIQTTCFSPAAAAAAAATGTQRMRRKRMCAVHRSFPVTLRHLVALVCLSPRHLDLPPLLCAEYACSCIPIASSSPSRAPSLSLPLSPSAGCQNQSTSSELPTFLRRSALVICQIKPAFAGRLSRGSQRSAGTASASERIVSSRLVRAMSPPHRGRSRPGELFLRVRLPT
jgi:hypothetical protein